MRKLLISFGIFLALLVAISYPMAMFISNHFYTYNKQNWILNMHGQNLDYAVLGSSRVFNMVDIHKLDSAWNKKGINLGTSGSCYAENYLIFSEFISRNKISCLILNMDEFSFNSAKSYSYPFHDLEFLSVFSRQEDVFSDYLPAWKFYLWKGLPISKYCEFNGNFTLKRTGHPHLDETKGSLLAGTREEEEDNKKRQGEAKRSGSGQNNLDEKYFFKILDLCAKNNIRPVLVTTPIYRKQGSAGKDFSLSFISAHPQLSKVPYIGFSELIDDSNYDYFIDYTHTTARGSMLYSRALGEKLRSMNF